MKALFLSAILTVIFGSYANANSYRLRDIHCGMPHTDKPSLDISFGATGAVRINKKYDNFDGVIQELTADPVRRSIYYAKVAFSDGVKLMEIVEPDSMVPFQSSLFVTIKDQNGTLTYIGDCRN